MYTIIEGEFENICVFFWIWFAIAAILSELRKCPGTVKHGMGSCDPDVSRAQRGPSAAEGCVALGSAGRLLCSAGGGAFKDITART